MLYLWQFLSFIVVGLQKKRSNKSFSSILTIFHQEIITFATQNSMVFEALQNKERERDSLVSIS